MNARYDLIVIGGGPGGYVAALRAAQLGWNVACVEKEKLLGGTCLRVGCIPSKDLLESSELFVQARKGLGARGIKTDHVSLDLSAMMTRKNKTVQTLARGIDGLLRKGKITRIKGTAHFLAPSRIQISEYDGTVEIQAHRVLIATGSKAASLDGVELDGERIGTSDEALSYSEVPRNLIVIGAGAIGLELGSVWQRLGARLAAIRLIRLFGFRHALTSSTSLLRNYRRATSIVKKG